jgi:hypothetical protein
MFLRNLLQQEFFMVSVCHLTSDQNMEETRKNALSPTTSKEQQVVKLSYR